MLMLPSAAKIYLAVEPVDMRKQFNGLWSLAEEKLREDPRLGALFVFTNKNRDRLKMLYWYDPRTSVTLYLRTSVTHFDRHDAVENDRTDGRKREICRVGPDRGRRGQPGMALS